MYIEYIRVHESQNGYWYHLDWNRERSTIPHVLSPELRQLKRLSRIAAVLYFPVIFPVILSEIDWELDWRVTLTH